MKRYYYLLAHSLSRDTAERIANALRNNRGLYWTGDAHYEVLSDHDSDLWAVFTASPEQERAENVAQAVTFIDGVLAGFGDSLDKIVELQARLHELEQAAMAAKEE